MLVSVPLPKRPSSVIVLGAGRFGRAAAVSVNRSWPDCPLSVADISKTIPDSIPGEHFSGTDAISLLRRVLGDSSENAVIVPSVPIHVAYEWVLSYFGAGIPVPVKLMETLPGAIAGADGCLYCSYSDFLCPEDCPEPETACTVTGEPWSSPLFQIMSLISIRGYTAVSLRSHLLFPGTGGYTAGALRELMGIVRGKRGRYLIATASRCHGVIHGFSY